MINSHYVLLYLANSIRFISAIVTRNGQAMKRVEERVCPIIEKGVDSWDDSQVEHVS